MYRAALLAIAVSLAFLPRAGAQEPTPAQRDFFEQKIKPILVEHCYKCHSHDAKKPKAGLFLDSKAALLQGGDNGPAVVPGQPSKSKLIEAIHYKNPDLQMPPKARLPDAVIADLEQWVKDGAPWPGDKSTVAAKYAFDLAKRKAEHWAWQPVKAAPPPAVKDGAWPRDPIDRFLLARLEDKNLKPAADADRRTLIRRLSFDLIGLPPTPAEVEAFLKDASPQAVENLVDRLLASQHFGERWGRHWLDLMRYAESRGHEFDFTNPNAYQYRDYVIRALNADVPYNQFVREHLAGDLLAKPRLHPKEGWNESILGTGFYFMGEQIHSPVDTTADKADRFDSTIDTIGKAFMGLTVACARCHDHKFDAISTKDYYAMFGFLESSSYRQVPFETLEHNREVAEELAKLRQRANRKIREEMIKPLDVTPETFRNYWWAASELFRTKAGEKRLEEMASERKLDAGLLKRWAKYLPEAAADGTDPLRFLARFLLLEAKGVGPKAVDLQSLQRAIKSDAELANDSAAKDQQIWRRLSVIANYQWPERGELDIQTPTGFSYGAGPLMRGAKGWAIPNKLTLSSDFAAVVFDRSWDNLKANSGVENDPGKLGQIFRAGRTFRSPTFDIHYDKVFYLVRGSAVAYAGVDGHTMLEGPLHGQLVRTVKTGNDFQWVEHNLAPYKNKRAFLEFTPLPGADFAVAAIVQGEKTPETAGASNPALAVDLLLAMENKLTPDLVVEVYSVGLPDLLGVIAEQSSKQLAKWAQAHADLLDPDPKALEKRYANIATPYLVEEANLIAQIKKESRLALGILDGSGVDEHVYIRGSYKAPGEKVQRRFLESLAGPDPLKISKGSGRLELAKQVVDPKLNPLFARVLVNRLWHHLFGRGIVASTDNFGVLGDRPTHPELLDHLADRFVKEGWSLKKMIRTLVLTRAYQMSNERDDKAEAADPLNLLLHRANLRRLEGEAIRDAMLAVSGRLDPKQFGPSVPVFLTPFQDGRGRPATGPLDGNGRRSVYLSVRRNFLSPFLLAFDTPTPFSTVGRRTVSNVPAQALILMNDPFVHQQAAVWAKRVQKDKTTPQERVAYMYESAFSRPPTQAELRRCLDFVEQQANATAAWTDFAHVLFNTKEFIYLP